MKIIKLLNLLKIIQKFKQNKNIAVFKYFFNFKEYFKKKYIFTK